jgi:spore maturation protein CgeB
VDTSDFKASDLGQLYHAGVVQIQATDPQSVLGGIPYRVFQTAASGKALITDLKSELVECFEPETEILGYRSMQEFTSQLSKALKNPTHLAEIGRAAHQRFEKEHTWSHRLATIEDWIGQEDRGRGKKIVDGG